MKNCLTGLPLVLALFAASPAATAQVLYRWIDDAGRTHLSDRVPEEYRERATRIDPKQFELTPQQRREADERSARRETDRILRERARAAASAPADPASAARPAASAARPGESECDRQWRIYFESERCFAPYRTANGGIKPEAYGKCQERTEPGLQCPRPEGR